MEDTENELRVGLKFSASDGQIYDYLKTIPRLHRGYELKKLITGNKVDAIVLPKGEISEVPTKEPGGNNKVKETLKFQF